MVTRASRRWIVLGLVLALLSVLTLATLAQGNNRGPWRAELSGLQEVPVILSPASGSFEARVTHDGAAVDYRLSYSGFTSNVSMAHIHIGQPGVNGGDPAAQADPFSRNRPRSRSRPQRARIWT